LTVEWRCARCGEVHGELPLNWAYDAPVYWKGLTEEQRAEGELTEDLCWFTDEDGPHFFVRGVLELPVHGADEPFGYGVWASLSEANMTRTIELWDDPRRVEEPPYFGWLSNSIPGYPETLNLKTSVVSRELDLRPAIVLEPTDHPLAVEQREGITLERVRELAELNLHAA
jgi:hypothetical protein